MSPRASRFVNAAFIVTMLSSANPAATVLLAQTLTPTAKVVNRSARPNEGPTLQSASVGAHRAGQPELQPLLSSVSERPVFDHDARTNVMIAAGLLVVAASVVRGDTGLKLGIIGTLLFLAVAAG